MIQLQTLLEYGCHPLRLLPNCPKSFEGVMSLEMARAHHVSFLSQERYTNAVAATKALCLVIAPQFKETVTQKYLGSLLIHSDPYALMVRVMTAQLAQEPPAYTGISSQAHIDPTAQVHPSAVVFPFVFVGPGAVVEKNCVLQSGVYVGPRAHIGENSILAANAVVQHGCVVGKNCFINSSAVIGGEGFGYLPNTSPPQKVPHLGHVVLGDGVDVGANTSIDRGTLHPTHIGKNVKIDSLVQIGHNSSIGDASVVCGLAGIAGSATVGARVTVAGQVGIGGQTTVADGTILLARTGVMKSITEPGTYSGFPAKPHREELRRQSALSRFINTLLGQKQQGGQTMHTTTSLENGTSNSIRRGAMPSHLSQSGMEADGLDSVSTSSAGPLNVDKPQMSVGHMVPALLNYDDICSLLPHRAPFLLVDRVLSCEPGLSMEAMKCVSSNDPYFAGHFPDNPIFPGVYFIEGLAQTAGLLFLYTQKIRGNRVSKKVMLTGVKEAKFKKPAVPGDVLQYQVFIDNQKQNFIWCHGSVLVNGQEIAKVTFSASLGE